MATRSPFSVPKRARDRGLVSLLAKAAESVRDLQRRTESIHQSGNLIMLGFRRRQLEELESVLARGAEAIGRRLAALDIAAGTVERAKPAPVSQHALLEPITFLAAYRSCCRALCAAMKEAAALADVASAASLRELIVQLEKQLWMIDEPGRSDGREDRRAVALFLSC